MQESLARFIMPLLQRSNNLRSAAESIDPNPRHRAANDLPKAHPYGWIAL